MKLLVGLMLCVLATACSNPSTETTSLVPGTPLPDAPTVVATQSLPDDGSADDLTPSSTTESTSSCTAPEPRARVDLRSDGSRIAPGSIDLTTAAQTAITLPGPAEWVLPDPGPEGDWYVVFANGSARRVTNDGQIFDAPPPLSAPPELNQAGQPVSAFDQHGLFIDPLTDGRVISTRGAVAALVGPTTRYGHGVLGDRIEASGVEWVERCGPARGQFEVLAPDVIESTAPMFGDIDNDGSPEIIVTVSNSDTGARLAAYELDGSLLAESDPIGLGNRWRNQLAVGPFGPNGETELIDIRTPHIGGTVQAFRLATNNGPGDFLRLDRVAASESVYTTHVLGSRNLDMGIALDANQDGRLDVVVATSDRSRLVALTRTEAGNGWAQVAMRDLGGRLTTNVATRPNSNGALVAVGVGDELLIWSN